MAKRNAKDLIEAYDDSQVEIYEGLKHILKRPSMYLGSLDTPQHTLEEALMNSLDEVKLGVANEINIVLHKDHSISIRDNGPGMKRETIEKAFEPFYSLRPGGTGLGLFISHELAMSNRIGMELLSEAGAGTDIRLSFPRV